MQSKCCTVKLGAANTLKELKIPLCICSGQYLKIFSEIFFFDAVAWIFNFWNISSKMYFSISFPRDSLTHEVWLEVLKSHGVHECGSSQYICSDHFTPDDYTVSNDGKKARLKKGSVPSIFDVALIECDDDDVLEDEIRTDEFHIEEIRELKTQNEKLQQEAEQLKCKYEHSVAISNSQFNYFKEIKKQQAKEIQELKRQVSHLKSLVDTVQKEKESMFGDLNVNVATFRLCK